MVQRPLNIHARENHFTSPLLGNTYFGTDTTAEVTLGNFTSLLVASKVAINFASCDKRHIVWSY